jgi:hypothetical protein
MRKLETHIQSLVGKSTIKGPLREPSPAPSEY